MTCGEFHPGRYGTSLAFLFNEKLTTLNNNGFYSEIDFLSRVQYLRLLLFFWNVNFLSTQR